MSVCYYFLNLLRDYDFVWANGQINGKWQISTLTAPKPPDWFRWNSNLRTISWRPPTMQNFISIRWCGWSRRIPNLPLPLKRQFPGFMFPTSCRDISYERWETNHHSMTYFLSNTSAKNYQNRLMRVEVIVCSISNVFETQCRIRGVCLCVACAIMGFGCFDTIYDRDG